MSVPANTVVASTFRQLFQNAVAYLLNPTIREQGQVNLAANDKVENVVVNGPRRVHVSEAFDDEGIVTGNSNDVVVDDVVNVAPQQALPRRRVALQRNNTIISERYAVSTRRRHEQQHRVLNAHYLFEQDEFVPPTSADNNTPASASEADNAQEGSTNGGVAGIAAPSFVFGSSSGMSLNPTLRRAGEHIFAVSQVRRRPHIDNILQN
jgi:hypothetical protein